MERELEIPEDLQKAYEESAGEGHTWTWTHIYVRGLIERIARLEMTLLEISAFAVGNGDVCEIIAKRARAAVRREEKSNEVYLGDGAYVYIREGFDVVLYTSDGLHTTNSIFLEPLVLKAFVNYLKHLKLGGL